MAMKKLKWMSPYEVLHNKAPTYDHPRIIGCLCYATVTKPHKDKFDDRGVKCVLLVTPAHLIVTPDQNVPTQIPSAAKQFSQTNATAQNMKSTRQSARPANTFAASDPTSFNQASADVGWFKAIDKEVADLKSNKTWTLTSLPFSHKPITSKWVYKTKYNFDGPVERKKARLVVRGFNQQEGLDYKRTFSLVTKLATVRVLIALATAKQWSLHLLDVNNTFLHGYIDEEIYMLSLQGYGKVGKGQVCKLNRSLYGLKQASRQWNHELTKFLTIMGYVQSKHDYSLFVKKDQGMFTTALVYVDDVLITGNSESEIVTLKQALDKKFTIKGLGLAKYFLDWASCLMARRSLTRTKQLKIDRYFTLADIMSKALGNVQHLFLIDKLGISYVPT
ncbi:retrovirus-related pol polyprotein from transposon TNT 1-94 [Tanacetum coccineum]